MINYIIIGIIGIYVIYVIYKKIKDIKKGKFCNYGCADCPSKGKCNLNK